MNKSKLQQLCHQNSWRLPEYTSMKDGPDHIPRFTATVTVNGLIFQSPSSQQYRSSKEAQNQAAKLAFDHFTAPETVLEHSPSVSAPLPNASTLSSSSGFSTSNANLDSKPSIGKIFPSTEKENVQDLQAKETSFDHIDDTRSEDFLHLYKNRLQSYLQKRNLPHPMYCCEINGPPHARRFKSKVSVEGKTYEAHDFFPTLKDAEHAAAKVAFESLSPDDVQEDEGLYKCLLQELAQKKDFPFPAYETTKSGPTHMPIFVSTVEIGDESFRGQEAKTKKQAEMNAAKVAYASLTDGRARRNGTAVSPGVQIMGVSEVSSSSLQSTVTDELQPNITPNTDEMHVNIRAKAYLSTEKEQAEKDKGCSNENHTALSPGSDNRPLEVSSSILQLIVTDELKPNILTNVTDGMQLNLVPNDNLLVEEEQSEKDKGCANDNHTALSPGSAFRPLEVSSSILQLIVTDHLKPNFVTNVNDGMQLNVRPNDSLLIEEEQSEKDEDTNFNAKRRRCSSPDDFTNSVLEFDYGDTSWTEYHSLQKDFGSSSPAQHDVC